MSYNSNKGCGYSNASDGDDGYRTGGSGLCRAEGFDCHGNCAQVCIRQGNR